MQQGDLNKVWEIKVLKRKALQEKSKQILERIAKQVQPIMRIHNWRVKVLSEMFPQRRELLGLNVGRGIEVKLRLRRPGNELEFLPFEEVLDTMLHELCHNAHGPHNASFYKLWDQLRKECEELISKGITGTGQGFDLSGRRLGGSTHQPPISSLRKVALGAAENRKRLNSLLPSGPLRLGGDKTIMSALSPVQAAAMAAERRLQDEIWCASASGRFDTETEGDCDLETVVLSGPNSASTSSNVSKGNNMQAGASAPRKRSHSGDTSNIIDLSQDVNTSSLGVRDAKSIKRSSGSIGTSTSSLPIGVSTSGVSLNQPVENVYTESVMWTCETCTLLNPPLAPVCEVCETVKPKDMSVKYKIWSCKFCTLENNVNLEKCSACGEWRYSRGPPLSTLPPNLGT